MTHRYEFTRTGGEQPMTLIFPEGAYETLPFEIRLMAPWSGSFHGDMASLKPLHRMELLHQGYVILKEAMSLLDAA
jgi:hypothetical protein